MKKADFILFKGDSSVAVFETLNAVRVVKYHQEHGLAKRDFELTFSALSTDEVIECYINNGYELF